MNRRRFFLPGALVVVIAAFVVVRLFAAKPPADATTGPSAAPPIATVPVRFGEFIERVNAQGRIGSPTGNTTTPAFAQSGIIQRIYVHVGEAVTTGSALAALERTPLENAVSQADGEAQAAHASYDQGRVSDAASRNALTHLTVARRRLALLESGKLGSISDRIAAQSTARQAALKVSADRQAVARDTALVAGGVIAAKDLDAARSTLSADEADLMTADAKVAASRLDRRSAQTQARADLAAAEVDVTSAHAQRGVLQAQVASADAKLAAANLTLQNGILRSPIDGVVTSIAKHAGEYIDPATPLMTIGPGSGREITVNVAPDLARKIAVGDRAEIALRGQVDGKLGGRVSAVVPAIDPQTQLAVVVLQGAPASAVSGDAVTATIEVAHLRALLVPLTAVVEDPQTGDSVVFVHLAHPNADHSLFEQRKVTIIASDQKTAAISSGLRNGEQIAPSGGYLLLAPSGG